MGAITGSEGQTLDASLTLANPRTNAGSIDPAAVHAVTVQAGAGAANLVSATNIEAGETPAPTAVGWTANDVSLQVTGEAPVAGNYSAVVVWTLSY